MDENKQAVPCGTGSKIEISLKVALDVDYTEIARLSRTKVHYNFKTTTEDIIKKLLFESGIRSNVLSVACEVKIKQVFGESHV